MKNPYLHRKKHHPLFKRILDSDIIEPAWKGHVIYVKLPPPFDHYLASSDGHIYTRWTIAYRNKTMSAPQSIEPTTCRYKQNIIKVGSIRCSIFVHVAIAHLFLPNPHELPCLNHIDGDKTNNAVWNLEWCTYSQNRNHYVKIARSRGLRLGRSKHLA